MIIDRESMIAWFKLLRYGKSVTVRGFQRLMGYNSPGKAQRILRRLERLGLVERTESGDYIVLKDTPPYLAAYMVLRGYVMPRSLVTAVFATATVLTYVLLARPPVYIIALLTILVLPYWIDTIHYIKSFKKILSEQ